MNNTPSDTGIPGVTIREAYSGPAGFIAEFGPFESRARTWRKAMGELERAVFDAVAGSWEPAVVKVRINDGEGTVFVWREPVAGWVYRVVYDNDAKVRHNAAHGIGGIIPATRPEWPTEHTAGREDAIAEGVYVAVDALAHPAGFRTERDLPTDRLREILGPERIAELVANARMRRNIEMVRTAHPTFDSERARRWIFENGYPEDGRT